MVRKRTKKRTRNKRTPYKKYSKKKKQSVKRKHSVKRKKQVPKNNIIQFESDYLNLRLRYLRGFKLKKRTKELIYLESLLKSLKKKQHN